MTFYLEFSDIMHLKIVLKIILVNLFEIFKISTGAINGNQLWQVSLLERDWQDHLAFFLFVF